MSLDTGLEHGLTGTLRRVAQYRRSDEVITGYICEEGPGKFRSYTRYDQFDPGSRTRVPQIVRAPSTGRSLRVAEEEGTAMMVNRVCLVMGLYIKEDAITWADASFAHNGNGHNNGNGK